MANRSTGIKGMKRTVMCGELGTADIGSKVCVMGWTNKIRNMGSLAFIDLRDRTGLIQIAVNDSCPAGLLETAASIHLEYVLAVKGTVSLRAPQAINDRMQTGQIEIIADEIRIISKSEPLPMQIDGDANVNEVLKLKYRYLDLRKPEMQRNLMLRHEIAYAARKYFYEKGFLEIETPILTKSTPEGARDYLVPSRVQNGKFYALPQSPQLFKQLLMLAGYDKYIQIARCFRDEDLRADRQPEFTQIDLEMSFVDVEDVLEVNEGFVKRLMKDVMGVDMKDPIPRLTYEDAMNRFGSDKPDIRFGMEIKDVTPIAEKTAFKVFSDNSASAGRSTRALAASGAAAKLSRKDIDALTEFVKSFGAKGLAYMTLEDDGIKSSISKFLSAEEMDAIAAAAGAVKGDIVFLVSDKHETALTALGELRLRISKMFELCRRDDFRFLWVTDFPLLEYNEEDSRFYAKHHPFTSPMDEDLDFLESDPGKVRAKAYDLVLNGTELGGGSIRIHSSELQSRMFKALGFTEEEAWEKFGFLLEAFKYGTPPHGGMAYGLDRLAMLMGLRTSIRDMIAFPKVQNASCLMTDSPGYVDEKQLIELGIEIASEES